MLFVLKMPMLGRRVEGDPGGLQVCRIVQRDSGFVAGPTCVGHLPEMPLDINGNDTTVFTHPNDWEML